jgi:hypothetical protein
MAMSAMAGLPMVISDAGRGSLSSLIVFDDQVIGGQSGGTGKVEACAVWGQKSVAKRLRGALRQQRSWRRPFVANRDEVIVW